MPIVVTLTDSAVAASTIINRALRLIGQIGAGESPTTDETADGLTALNDMIDTWRNDRLLVMSMREDSCAMSANTQTYTIGTGATANTNRPVKIVDAYVSLNNITYPVRIVNESEWASIGYRTSTSDVPNTLYYQPAVPTGNLNVYPVPTTTSTLYLVSWVPLEAFESSSDTIYLAPGFRDALAFNLAVNLAPEYDTEAGPTVQRKAMEALAWIRKTSSASSPRRMNTELGAMYGPYRANIYTDGQ